MRYRKYRTREGDTFDALALSAYNEERMSDHIIQANMDYCDMLIFPAGIELKIPIVEIARTAESLPPWRRND